MSGSNTSNENHIPRRDYGSRLGSKSLASTLPIVGLGCSSFSTFFWTDEELSKETTVNNSNATTITTTDISNNSASEASSELASEAWTATTLDKNHPRVQEWIRTIHTAINEYGITLLDTAPWYGHGTSEIVIGWAMESLPPEKRESLTINTKVGRYEADPTKQFDFSHKTTIASVKRSLDRMKCIQYIDVIQLHDPEFAPSLEEIMNETIPALIECKTKGWCKSLGMTGYPLEVQYQLLQRTLQDYDDGTKIWDQALTYGHFNLHNSSLFDRPLLLSSSSTDNNDDTTTTKSSSSSFAEYCDETLHIGLLAAAPLSMGLLTNFDANKTLPEWHPASPQLKQCCKNAATICRDLNVEITELALLYALSNPKIACTIIGCKSVKEVEYAARIANRLKGIDTTTNPNNCMSQNDILKHVCTDNEYEAYMKLMDKTSGPFASVWSDGTFRWDGTEIARDFWKEIDPNNVPNWQLTSS